MNTNSTIFTAPDRIYTDPAGEHFDIKPIWDNSIEYIKKIEQAVPQYSRLDDGSEKLLWQPFYVDFDNQIWGPEGLYCECLEHATQQICDALNLLPSALFWLAYAEGNHIDAGDIPDELLVKLRETIGTSGHDDRRAGAGQDFDYATKAGLIQ